MCSLCINPHFTSTSTDHSIIIFIYFEDICLQEPWSTDSFIHTLSKSNDIFFFLSLCMVFVAQTDLLYETVQKWPGTFGTWKHLWPQNVCVATSSCCCVHTTWQIGDFSIGSCRSIMTPPLNFPLPYICSLIGCRLSPVSYPFKTHFTLHDCKLQTDPDI